MSKISVIGIAGESVFLSVERFGKTGETTVATSYHSELGGKGFNQAIAAARFGVDVSFLGAAYIEDIKHFTDIAERCGVTARFVGKCKRSPYAVITTDKNGDNQVCVYGGAQLEEKDVEAFESEIRSSDILLLNNETPYSVNKKALEIAKANGVRVILNPAPARKCDKEFLDDIFIFTPNEHETEGLEEYRNVIVTLGDKGCFIRENGEHISAEKLSSVVDTTGAGDTFNGILAACIANGESIRSACEKANVGAAIKVGRQYILESIPSREEIEKFMEGRNG
ncbi:MAG: ribokinase [Clostridia bacterium]|nr:ribokinase [Clostridia bacterium]